MRAYIAGTGSSLPPHAVSTALLGRLVERHVPTKGASWACERLGINERRFLCPLDPNTGYPTSTTDEIDLAEAAARKAIASAGLEPSDISRLWYVTCTQPLHRSHFSGMASELHRRLGLSQQTLAVELDAGCGGALHAIDLATGVLLGTAQDNALVVASNAPSSFFQNWEAYALSGAWLSMYVFGDGAGAVLLRRTETPKLSGIIASYVAMDPLRVLMEYGPRDGADAPVYHIDGREVFASFGTYASKALVELRRRHLFTYAEVKRFYFHQVNRNVLRKFISEENIPEEKVAIHIDRYGNLAAAATLVLLDEDREAGRVTEGDLCLFCTVGAGVQYGAMLVRL